MVMDGQAELSIWGTVVWNHLRKLLFADVRLKEPLSDRLHVKDAVKKSFADLSKDLRVEVNEALEALCAHLDHKCRLASVAGPGPRDVLLPAGRSSM